MRACDSDSAIGICTIAVLFMMSCGLFSCDDREPVSTCSFATTPVFMGNDNALAPQVGIVAFDTAVPTVAYIRISGGGEAWTIEETSAMTAHRQLVLGVKPDTEYEAVIMPSGDCGADSEQTVSWRSPSLPEGFPPLELVSSSPERMAPGMTLFNLVSPVSYIIVVDDSGQVRWYYAVPSENCGMSAHRLLSNRHLIFSSGRRHIVELDWLGHPVVDWTAANAPPLEDVESETAADERIQVDVDAMHHSIQEMPNGNILTLSCEGRVVDDYPTSTSDRTAPTATTLVSGDVIVEFTRTGEVVKRIALLDLLDPTRVGYGSDTEFWGDWYPGAADWSHGNAVIYDAESDAYIVSLRHQDAVVKIDRSTESVVWILGYHENWKSAWQDKLLTPIDDLIWPSHQHAVTLTNDGIGMYDNGNVRAPAFEVPQSDYYSRAVEYVVDEQLMTVWQAWSFGEVDGDDHFFSYIMSDADWQPVTGNILITSGAMLPDSAPRYSYMDIREVDDAGDTVFQLIVGDRDGSERQHYSGYSGDRIPDIRQFSFY